jgi:hypothetical protein
MSDTELLLKPQPEPEPVRRLEVFKVGGFSAPGGAVAKIRMLELEGVHVAPARPIQRSFGF